MGEKKKNLLIQPLTWQIFQPSNLERQRGSDLLDWKWSGNIWLVVFI